ncbi:hypothetical protein V6N12_039678 [Hibiscus sabdariffa]|uniref:Uncharacterized protein n=1 Tax=Hibiscus sabdariffa TaxID=183260 RepID=A0ABR2E377_9ROSI
MGCSEQLELSECLKEGLGNADGVGSHDSRDCVRINPAEAVRVSDAEEIIPLFEEIMEKARNRSHKGETEKGKHRVPAMKQKGAVAVFAFFLP